MGIKLWQKTGHRFGVITARSSHIVKLRMDELGVDFIRQGTEQKLAAAQQIIEELNLQSQNVCYIGDDLTDVNLMKSVGMSASVADAGEDVKKVAHYVTKSAGGKGAIRELIEMILKSQKRWNELLQGYGI